MTVDELIARVQALPDALLLDALPECTEAVRRESLATARAGTTPEGVPWAPRKDGSGAVLVNAADAVKVGLIGRTIWIRLLGIEARHHRGRVKGKTKRQIIPVGHIPPNIARAMGDVLTRRFEAWAAGVDHG